MGGCSELQAPKCEQLACGYILLLPGVGGEAIYMVPFMQGLREAGIDQAIEVDMWGVRPLGTLHNLTAYAANRKEAQRLADKITSYRGAYPCTPITIIGYSGGGGMAVFTAEALPADLAMDRIVLIAPALSPTYDLAVATKHCQRGIVSYYSRRDWGQIGLGTRLLGTMDRQNTDSAGYVGFRGGDNALREIPGLTQIPWVPEWGRFGHGGDHLGYLSRAWAREVLAPQLKRSTTEIVPRPCPGGGSEKLASNLLTDN